MAEWYSDGSRLVNGDSDGESIIMFVRHAPMIYGVNSVAAERTNGRSGGIREVGFTSSGETQWPPVDVTEDLQ